MLPFPLLLLGLSCVISYGERDLQAPISQQDVLAGADFTAMDARLLLLLENSDDRDRELRLQSARDLLKQARLWPRDAQDDLLAFMLVMLDVEERVRPGEVLDVATERTRATEMEMDRDKPLVREQEFIDVPIALLDEEVLDDEAPTPGVTPPTGTGATAVADDTPEASAAGSRKRLASEVVAEAREALGKGDFEEALLLLESLGDKRRGPATEGIWTEAMNGFVHEERNRTGQMFLQARSLPTGPDKKAMLEEVRDNLKGLLAKYPESTYAGALQRNLVMVERELTRL